MSSIRALIKTHPVVSYYILAFAISWGALLPTMIIDGIPATKEQLNALMPIAIGGMLLGPLVSGLVMIGLVDGSDGFRELGARLRTWRVGLGWYALALLLSPLVLLAVLMGLSLFSPVYLPGIFTTADKGSRLIMGLSSGLVVGLCEEIGWTGFVTPKLLRRHSILATGLIVGVLWGLWHILPIVIWASGAYSAPLSPASYIAVRSLVYLLGGLVATRVMMVWIYDHTRSLLLLALMHFTQTAVSRIYEPEGIGGTSLYVYDVVGLAALWIVVAIVAAVTRELPLHRPAAAHA